jgi:predicted DNA-binding protein
LPDDIWSDIIRWRNTPLKDEIMDHTQIEVTNAQQVASLVSGTGSSTEFSASKSVAYRIPVHLCAVVDSMAAKAGKSRNAMLNLLVQVGIDSVRSQLQDDVVEALQHGEAEALSRLLNETTETIAE